MYAIKLNDVHKVYRIYNKSNQRIKDLIFNTKNYREYHALKGLSVEIPKGEAVGVLGKNGAGKSTLLKIITGVVKPTSGEVDIQGRISAILELNSGFDEELSGYENIFVKGAILGFSKQEIEKNLEDIIDFADIGEHLYQPVRTYSSGMKSRLGFAIAVNVDPDILIVDEALAVGDDVFKTKCLDRMSEFRRQGKTIFFVSHSLFTVKSFCTKCMWIKNGELVEYGDMGPVVAAYQTFLKEEKAKTKKKKDGAKPKAGLDRKDYIKISKFKFANSEKAFRFGEDIVYSFHYEITKELSDLKWSFTLWDVDEKEIYSSDKTGMNYLVESSMGKHEITIKLKNPSLLPGKYLLSGEIRDGAGLLYAGYSNKRPFEVLSDEQYRGSGIIHIEHEMVINK